MIDLPSLPPGWTRLDEHVGAHAIPGVGVRIVTNRGVWRRVKAWTWEAEGYISARGILTVRPGSPPPTLGVLRPFGSDWYHDGPGGFGIDPCGEGSLLEHDAILQRSPVGLYDMATGELRDPSTVRTPSGGYALDRGWHPSTTLPECADESGEPLNEPGVVSDPAVLSLLPPNGQHLVRAYRSAILHQRDPFVRMDLEALATDAAVSWSTARARQILATPAHKGHRDVGREWGWVAYLASMTHVPGFQRRLSAIAQHVAMPNGLLQRLKEGEFYGSPQPWGTGPGHSDVPSGVDVAQDIEAHIQVVALYSIGMVVAARKLAALALDRPLAKWIDCDTGLSVGDHGADSFHPWPALGVWFKLDPGTAREAMSRWAVPKPEYMGGAAGPYAATTDLIARLRAWSNPGMSRWALEALGPGV